MEAADFSGYATKAGLECSDGRTITPQAFQHMDGEQVPLVWQHGHNSPDNVLGHVLLEARKDGIYAHGFFNDTKQGQNTKLLVKHKDVNSLSIFATQIVERGKAVLHGTIAEVSLVLRGANPGAKIDYISFQHADGSIMQVEDEVIITTGLGISFGHSNGTAEDSEEVEDNEIDDDDENDKVDDDDENDKVDDVAHADGPTVEEIYNSLSDIQKNVVNYMLQIAAESTPADAVHSETNTTENADETPVDGDLTHQEGTTVGTTRNVFEQNDADNQDGKDRITLSHDAMRGIVADMKKGATLQSALKDYALSHGITDIELLFPDAKSVQDRPEWNKRNTEWVAGVLNGTRHTPFTRIKTMSADLTLEEARAKGYVKGALKKEQFFGLLKRTTGPTTIYKKQKLDRDDIIDVTDFDVVAWMWTEMRFMLEEEIAVSILIGDGRESDDADKVKDPAGATDGNGIRSIANDDDMYAPTVYVNLDDANSSWLEFLDEVILSRRLYKGSGTPTFYTTELVLGKLLTLRNSEGNRMFRNVSELVTELRVDAIVPVEAMERVTDLIGIMVNLSDYAVGTDKGGEITKFDDFDIDYNQYKYLIEGRLSGALTKLRSALVYRKVAGGAALVAPAAPTQDDDEVTIVTTTGATYKVGSFTGAVTYNSSPVTADLTVTAAHPVVIPDGGSVTIYAIPTSSSYYFENNFDDEWTFTYEA